MTTQQSERPVLTQEQAKTPATRLMDLLAGWSTYVSGDEDNQMLDPELSAEEIDALYAQVAEWAFQTTDPDDEKRRVIEFVIGHLLPLLCRSAPSDLPSDALQS